MVILGNTNETTRRIQNCGSYTTRPVLLQAHAYGSKELDARVYAVCRLGIQINASYQKFSTAPLGLWATMVILHLCLFVDNCDASATSFDSMF